MAKGKNRHYVEGRVVWMIGFVHEEDMMKIAKEFQGKGGAIWSYHMDNLPKEYGGAIYTIIGTLPNEKKEAHNAPQTE